MTVSKTASKTADVDAVSAGHPGNRADDGMAITGTLQMGELSELLGYSLKRAQLKVFEDFLRCVAPLQLTPAQFSVLLLLDNNPGRNQTEIANTLGILWPNFVALLDGLEGRELCVRTRSHNSRLSSASSIDTKFGRRMPSVVAISVWLRPGFFSSSTSTENCAGVSCSDATQRMKSSKMRNCARLNW